MDGIQCVQMLTELEHSIPVKKLSIECEIHMSIAFVTMKGVFVNNSGPGVCACFELPRVHDLPNVFLVLHTSPHIMNERLTYSFGL